MSVIYNATLKAARMALVIAAIDTGGAGYIEIMTAGSTVLATIPLNATCGSLTGSVLTFTLPLTATASVSGTAASADIKDGAGTVIISGLVVGVTGSLGADIVLSSVALVAGQPVTLTAASIAHG
jgi:hypothetical protein